MPILSPNSQTNRIELAETGSHSAVLSALTWGIYTSSAFISGCVDAVTHVYRRLGGDVLGIELSAKQVYHAYEEATLKY
jgi:hypothetical protein